MSSELNRAKAALALAKIKKRKTPNRDFVLSVDDTGQRVLQLPEQTEPESVFDRIQSVASYPADFVIQSAMKGGADLARGVASFPFDLAAEFTRPEIAERQAQTAERIRKAIPDVRGGRAGTDLGGVLAQYGAPAIGAYRGVTAALQNAPRAVQYIGGLLGATGADIAATVPDEASTIGTLIGAGPTQITPEDTPLSRRVKVGAETPFVALPIDAVGRGLSKAFVGRGELERGVGAALRESAIDREAAEQAIQAGLARQEVPGFQPTTGTLADDIGLLALERGVSTRPSYIQQQRENIEALSRATDEAVQTTGQPEALAEAARAVTARQTLQASEVVEQSKTALKKAEDDLSGEISAIQSLGSRDIKESASRQIDEGLRQELSSLNAEKNRLYDAIDPDGAIAINISPLATVAKEISTPKNPLQRSTTNKIKNFSGGIIDDILEAKKKGKPQSYKDLINVRSGLNAGIKQAMEQGEGAVVTSLRQLRNVVDEYTDALSQGRDDVGEFFGGTVDPSVAAAAKTATDYYKNTFAPRFKEGVGGRFRQDVRTGVATPTTTADPFLLGKTEAAEQLSLIIKESETKDVAEIAVQDYMVSVLARRISGQTPSQTIKNVKKFSDDFGPVLEQFPSLQKEVATLASTITAKSAKQGTLAKQVKDAEKALTLTEKEISQSALRYFTNSDADEAIQKIFNSSNPSREIEDLLSRINGDIAAKNGLKAAVRDEVSRLVRAPGSEGFDVTVNRINRFLNTSKYQKAIGKLFEPDELAKINTVKNRLNELRKIDQRTTLNSITGQIAADSEKVRTLLAAYYGIVKGRGVFMISRMVGNLVRGAPAKDVAADVLARAMIDPELALRLMQKNTAENNRKLGLYLTNNVFGESLDE